MNIQPNESIDLDAIKHFVKFPLFNLSEINALNSTTEIPFTGVFSEFDGLWYYAAHHVGLNKTDFYQEFGKVDKTRGRLSSWIKAAFEKSHPNASYSTLDHLNKNMDTITMIYKFVKEMKSKDGTIMVSRNEDEFCKNASSKSGKNVYDDRDDRDDYTKITCHRRKGCYHYNAHQLWSINNYYICKFYNKNDNLLFRFYFYWDVKNNNFYQTGGYRWNIKHMAAFNGYQRFINILISRMFFNRMDTRAVESEVHINTGSQLSGFINENSGKDKYKTWRIFHDDHSQNQEFSQNMTLLVKDSWNDRCGYRTDC